MRRGAGGVGDWPECPVPFLERISLYVSPLNPGGSQVISLSELCPTQTPSTLMRFCLKTHAFLSVFAFRPH